MVACQFEHFEQVAGIQARQHFRIRCSVAAKFSREGEGAGHRRGVMRGEDPIGEADIGKIAPHGVDTRVDAAVVLGGSISGTVTDGATGAPLDAICVQVFKGDRVESLSGVTTTEPDGTYRIGEPKTRRGRRTLPLSPKVAALLRAHVKGRPLEALVFPAREGRRNLRKAR